MFWVRSRVRGERGFGRLLVWGGACARAAGRIGWWRRTTGLVRRGVAETEEPSLVQLLLATHHTPTE